MRFQIIKKFIFKFVHFLQLSFFFWLETIKMPNKCWTNEIPRELIWIELFECFFIQSLKISSRRFSNNTYVHFQFFFFFQSSDFLVGVLVFFLVRGGAGGGGGCLLKKIVFFCEGPLGWIFSIFFGNLEVRRNSFFFSFERNQRVSF